MIAEWIKDIPNWEKEYLSMNSQLTQRQKESLSETQRYFSLTGEIYIFKLMVHKKIL